MKHLNTILHTLKLNKDIRFYHTSNNMRHIFHPKKERVSCKADCEFCNISIAPNICMQKYVIYNFECVLCNIFT